jgi:hypothetical protein
MTSEKETSLINYQQISISIGRTLAPFLFGLVMVALVGKDKHLTPNI